MADLISRMTENVAFIQQLGDNPNADNNLNAALLKAWFDKAPLVIQKYINETLILQIEEKFGSVDKWIEQADQSIKDFIVGSGFVPVDGSVPMTGNLNMGNKQIKNLSNPTEEGDAVPKSYADAILDAAVDAQNTADAARAVADSKCFKSSKTVMLRASGWSGKYQTVTVEGVVSDDEKCDVLTSPMESSREEYNDCVVRCTAQGNGTLTFMCDDVPENDLTVGVLVLL